MSGPLRKHRGRELIVLPSIIVEDPFDCSAFIYCWRHICNLFDEPHQKHPIGIFIARHLVQAKILIDKILRDPLGIYGLSQSTIDRLDRLKITHLSFDATLNKIRFQPPFPLDH